MGAACAAQRALRQLPTAWPKAMLRRYAAFQVLRACSFNKVDGYKETQPLGLDLCILCSVMNAL